MWWSVSSSLVTCLVCYPDILRMSLLIFFSDFFNVFLSGGLGMMTALADNFAMGAVGAIAESPGVSVLFYPIVVGLSGCIFHKLLLQSCRLFYCLLHGGCG
ncbi:hypothetical protein EV426DRAFT_325782 [Tirmania nivea]|nr:hypothetical protein EV426DRAFT_325782 [Tirmania nivea]